LCARWFVFDIIDIAVDVVLNGGGGVVVVVVHHQYSNRNLFKSTTCATILLNTPLINIYNNNNK
jgi:hypothetical protein